MLVNKTETEILQERIAYTAQFIQPIIEKTRREHLEMLEKSAQFEANLRKQAMTEHNRVKIQRAYW